ncbi:hypothetical protein BD289DRAFT_137187 [Coniella lustricola]|uniref:Uncharacterized protein n=1 Tax=Coniella lustricola TaxID=2025994 RepID=A0A2T2ZVL7_9PEZI|nr:hypothetical protein BD289DRAFT_137187 [Coniella lustricola]
MAGVGIVPAFCLFFLARLLLRFPFGVLFPGCWGGWSRRFAMRTRVMPCGAATIHDSRFTIHDSRYDGMTHSLCGEREKDTHREREREKNGSVGKVGEDGTVAAAVINGVREALETKPPNSSSSY